MTEQMAEEQYDLSSDGLEFVPSNVQVDKESKLSSTHRESKDNSLVDI